MGGGPTGSADQGKELGLRPLGGNETLESRWGGLVVKGTLGHRRDRAGRGQSRADACQRRGSWGGEKPRGLVLVEPSERV